MPIRSSVLCHQRDHVSRRRLDGRGVCRAAHNLSDTDVVLYDPDRGRRGCFHRRSRKTLASCCCSRRAAIVLKRRPPVAWSRSTRALQKGGLSKRFGFPRRRRFWRGGSPPEQCRRDHPTEPAGRAGRRGDAVWIAVDRVRYSDGSHHEVFPAGLDLWPPEADGGGFSLGRIAPAQYGSDPLNWRAVTPSPGAARAPGSR